MAHSSHFLKTCKLISRIVENLPRGMSEEVMQAWIQDPKELKKLLSGLEATPLVPGSEPELPFELYYHQEQMEMFDEWYGPVGLVDGPVFEAHLKETGLIERSLTLDSEIVKEWLANPIKYPRDFVQKDIHPTLWGSSKVVGEVRKIPILIYADELTPAGERIQQVRVYWRPAHFSWQRQPALLKKVS